MGLLLMFVEFSYYTCAISPDRYTMEGKTSLSIFSFDLSLSLTVIHNETAKIIFDHVCSASQSGVKDGTCTTGDLKVEEIFKLTIQ